MPIETLKNNLFYLKKRHRFTNADMDLIMCHNSRIFNHIIAGKSIPSLPALKSVSDYFKISIDDLIRTDISKHNKHDLFDYYESAQRSLNNDKKGIQVQG